VGTEPARKRVIINADDLGFSQGITEGIVLSHAEGVVTSTTLAANMPGAAAAVRRLAAVPNLGVGVHLNVSQGRPLSRAGLALADDDGVMRQTAVGVLVGCTLRPWLLGAIAEEFDAQLRWALDHGIRPTHLDSHRHSHGFPPIFAVVARLAKRYGIRFIRRLREVPPGLGWRPSPVKQRRNRAVLNLLGAANGLIGSSAWGTTGMWGIAHTGLIDTDFLVRVAAAARPGVTEIMVHPAAGDDVSGPVSRLRQSRLAETTALCDPAVKRAFDQHGVELIHYGQI